jgi:8-oxo-dGTP pyrophosphatase MutT (NUDIX family)
LDLEVGLHALITAGGTAEPIDDVRVVTNSSTGRFGAAIANALVARGVEVTLLASHALMGHPEWVDPRVKRVGFGSFLDLRAALIEQTQSPPDLLFMAAAVADYSPVPTHGKIRSDAEEITIRMRRNPKLLPTLREQCGENTFLVGFKLLSGVTRAELVAVADRQRVKGHLDLTVANDLATFTPNRHPVVLVEANRTTDFSSSKAGTAAFLVDHVLGHVVQKNPDVRRGASATLFNRSTQQVLVGRRLKGAFLHQWCVPGGQVEPGESPLDAARRELREEVGLHAPSRPLGRIDVRVADTPDWHVSGFVFAIDGSPPPVTSSEFEPVWMPLNDALALQPMVLGADTVLTWIRDHLADSSNGRVGH